MKKVSEDTVKKIKDIHNKLIKEVEKVIIGQREVLERIFIAFLARGHAIIIGVPGLAKTLLIRAMAQALNLNFNRVQFTPDLMPSDIIGSEILEEDKKGKRVFKFVKGPIFTNILLADEINRTPPKTQSALLQAMQERMVTVNGKTYKLDEPFFVLATQNPIEQEGTYPLPEAQLDRFFFSINIDYPDEKAELEIAKKSTEENLNKIKKIATKNELLKIFDIVQDIPIADSVLNYAVKLIRLTRPAKTNPVEAVNEFVKWGAGPRASQYLVLASKINALLNGRFSVSINDINFVAYNILSHRIILNFSAEAENINVKFIIDSIIKKLVKSK